MSSFRSSFVVTRKEAGSFVNGKWVEGDTSTFTIQASVQPLRGDEIQLLPEGRRNSQAVRIYTDTLLYNKTNESTNPDIVTAFETDFEVLTVEPWQSNVINHFKCLAVKVSE